MRKFLFASVMVVALVERSIGNGCGVDDIVGRWCVAGPEPFPFRFYRNAKGSSIRRATPRLLFRSGWPNLHPWRGPEADRRLRRSREQPPSCSPPGWTYQVFPPVTATVFASFRRRSLLPPRYRPWIRPYLSSPPKCRTARLTKATAPTRKTSLIPRFRRCLSGRSLATRFALVAGPGLS
jgi:hypothetical protein